MSYYIGVDVGGTFTDCVAVSDTGALYHAKSLSTRPNPTEGMLEGLASLAAETGTSLSELLADTERFSHGTTIGTNLVVERKGARVGLICTLGHRDAILMMRGAGATAGKPVEQVYQPHGARPPSPIVPRRSILELEERIDRDGQIVVALQPERARAAIQTWLASNRFEAVSICLLWSFRNPSHELAVAGLVRELDHRVFVSVSSQVAPRLGEYERAVATVINAYVGPASSAYLESFGDKLRSRGLRKPVLVMQSNGGVLAASAARTLPLTLIDSGPTGGLAGTAAVAESAGHRHVIATDMGGTSFDVGLVIDGRPLIATERTLEQYTYQLPHLDVRSIACGGGSIASVDERTGALRVGPQSAGSEPGPACYGRGGMLPTVTDADVVLGLLRPESFLGGRMPLDAKAAHRAVATVASRVGLSVDETAAGIVRINNANAALLVRQRTIEQGLDPRDFVLYAFGGAGPLHAFGFAAELGVRQVVVPLGNGASTLSACGIASADAVRYFEAEFQLRAPLDPAQLAAALARCEADARRAVDADGFEVSCVERTLLMRYVGQYLNSMPVALPAGPVDVALAARVLEDFGRNYERVYGEGARIVFQAAEVFAIRLKLVGNAGFKVAIRARAGKGGANGALRTTLDVFWPEQTRRVPTRIYDGIALGTADTVVGPALVELPHTTVAVAPGQRLTADSFGNLALLIPGGMA